MDKQKNNDEIVSLNDEIYENISINELEERLELACWTLISCIIRCWEDCTRYDPTGGVNPDDGDSSNIF